MNQLGKAHKMWKRIWLKMFVCDHKNPQQAQLNSQSSTQINHLKSTSHKFKPNSVHLKLGSGWEDGVDAVYHSNYIHREGVMLNEIGAIAEIFQLDWLSIKLQPVEEMTLALRSLPQWTSMIIHKEIGPQRISTASKETTLRETKEECVLMKERIRWRREEKMNTR